MTMSEETPRRGLIRAACSFIVVCGAVSLAEAQPPVLALEVEGYSAAAFVAPSGEEERPVVIALHGNFDRPEWMCAAFQSIVRDRAFLLCPRGELRTDAPDQDRWSLPPAHRLSLEVAAARAALERRFPGRLMDGPDVWVGFSQGAHRVSRMAAAEPAAFPRIQLVEGGNALWRLSGARRYARADGRVALVCAMRWCEQRGERLVQRLERGRARARLERIPAAHHDRVTMRPAIQRTFDWLIEGDPRFAP